MRGSQEKKRDVAGDISTLGGNRNFHPIISPSKFSMQIGTQLTIYAFGNTGTLIGIGLFPLVLSDWLPLHFPVSYSYIRELWLPGFLRPPVQLPVQQLRQAHH